MTTSATLIPYRSKDTMVRPDYGGRPNDARLLAEVVTKKGEIFRGEDIGQRESPPPLPHLHPSPHCHLPMSRAWKVFLPPSTLVATRVALQAPLLCLCSSCHSLFIRLVSRLVASLGKVTSRRMLHAYPKSCIRMHMR
jgi:hypothetical protein